jgi:bifunctional DNA-binding transcriptional regulator/antitoxin component of YhaV-PrlF toxin-antitoxin module
MAKKIVMDLDERGRIHLPSETLDALGLSPGMTLIIEADENGGAWLNVQADEPVLVDKGGVLVIRAEAIGDIDEAIRRDREERIATFVEQSGL